MSLRIIKYSKVIFLAICSLPVYSCAANLEKSKIIDINGVDSALYDRGKKRFDLSDPSRMSLIKSHIVEACVAHEMETFNFDNDFNIEFVEPELIKLITKGDLHYYMFNVPNIDGITIVYVYNSKNNRILRRFSIPGA